MLIGTLQSPSVLILELFSTASAIIPDGFEKIDEPGIGTQIFHFDEQCS
jgi:hypothetical protein